MMKKMIMSMALATTLGLGIIPTTQAALIVVMPGSVLAISPNFFSWMAFGGSIAAYEYGYKYHGHLKSVTFGYLGLGLLMNSKTKSVCFGVLTSEEARELKLSNEELTSYNAEVDRLNALAEEAFLTLSQTSKENREEVAKELHDNLKLEVSTDTLSAMKKVVSSAFKTE